MSEGLASSSAPRRVHDLPAEERPRERLARHGVSALSSRELLALLVGTGSGRTSVLDLADSLLASGLRGLAGRSLGELEAVRGLGRAKATRVLAALELGVRLASEGRGPMPCLRTPEDSARYLLPRYGARPVETVADTVAIMFGPDAPPPEDVHACVAQLVEEGVLQSGA